MAVLHIVFMILKIIGILLLVLLGLFVLAVLALLFCPVRYQARGYREQEKYGGKAGVSWLFHLLAFSVWYDSGQEKTGYEIRVLGIPLLRLLKALKKKKRKKKRKRRAAAVPSRITTAGEKRNRKETEAPGISREEEQGQERREEQEIQLSERTKGEAPSEEAGKIPPVFFRKLREIFRIPGKMIRALKNFRLTAGDICDKIKKMKKFLESEKFRRGMGLILGEGKKLLAHVRPRKIQGCIKFGTEDPCLTGEILGMAGIFYPLYGENFNIEPYFDQKILEGSVSFRGRIYGIMVLISAVKIIRSRDIRFMIRHFRQ